MLEHKLIKSQDMTDALYDCFGYKNKQDFIASTGLFEKELDMCTFPLLKEEAEGISEAALQDWNNVESDKDSEFILYLYGDGQFFITDQEGFIAEMNL